MLVPFVPTPPEVAEAMLDCAKASKEDIVVDLGSGDGIILYIAKKKFNVRLAVGIELRQDLCRNSYKEKKNYIEVICGDMIYLSPIIIPKATIITTYLSTITNEKIEPLLLKYGKKGLRIVSHDFVFPNLKYYETRRVIAEGVLGPTEHYVYCYRL
ncbi:MAG: hypothetical protein QXV69_02120 [Sulfolobaceae archaeon]